ncbi:MAG: 7-cyano-7-deazaguanine synthase QueC [Parachlamydiaceae bacterium]|nr:7-cyano-7-deazaguanine synthase QueC [Parachlamydiaceae bacterium]
MKAIILLSGGVDSTVVLAMALGRGLVCYGISFDYGQRHKVELKSAALIAKNYGIEQKIIIIDPQTFTKSSLTTASTVVPKDRSVAEITSLGIPSTYVPARNTLFLSYALGQAEILNADEIHVGFNAMDYNCYPDCRPEYLEAFQRIASLGTVQGIKGNGIKVIAPLIHMDKTEIFKHGKRLHAPLHLTFSCYDPSIDELPCQRCDACVLRTSADSFCHSSKNEMMDGG